MENLKSSFWGRFWLLGFFTVMAFNGHIYFIVSILRGKAQYSDFIINIVYSNVYDATLVSSFNVAPRFSLAHKTGAYLQISMAGGKFYQTSDYQYYYRNKILQFENASHAVLNYQIIKNKRTFRMEGYHKSYDNLVRKYVTPIITQIISTSCLSACQTYMM